MEFRKLQVFVDRAWDTEVLPTLAKYIAIPCESPSFDTNWAAHGHTDHAVDLLACWARDKLSDISGATVDVLTSPGRTPLIFVNVPGDTSASVLLYGHLDKQPPMMGWAPGRSAWAPVTEGDRLYGRGGADDGYALFAAITAILALRAIGLHSPRCMILIESCEESGSLDLPHYVELLAQHLGAPDVVIALDAYCGNYEQLWLTTSLRGQVSGTLTVRVLQEGMHSGDASGVVPSSFRIARHLLSRLEDAESGMIIPREFHATIPDERRIQAERAGVALGAALKDQLPWWAGTRAVVEDMTELLLNRTWRPQLAVIGLDGLPIVQSAAAVMHAAVALKISLRLPPTLDAQNAAERLKLLLEENPPYACEVRFHLDLVSQGWHASSLSGWLARSVETASQLAFGRSSASLGGGGGIPFLALLGERYPNAQFLVTGVLGPQSNAHGPNEFLHIPMAKRLTSALALVLHDAERFSANEISDSQA